MKHPVTKLILSPKLIYRVPQFSFDADLTANWPDLKTSIKESSEEFYKEISGIASADEIQNLSANHAHTIWKYFNRAKYRATPYGNFAAVGIGWINNNSGNRAMLENKQFAHQFMEWEKIRTDAWALDDLLKNDWKLFSNTSWYRVGDRIRFVSRNKDGYELAELPFDQHICMVLQHCNLPSPISIVLNLLVQNFDIGTSNEILQRLLDDQLLIPEIACNIIGEDHFKRTGSNEKTDKGYIIAERKLQSGTFDKSLFEKVPKAVMGLHRLLTSYFAPDLENFSNRFSEKFNEAEVPLMIALDPELGVGYGNMEKNLTTSDLIDQLLAGKVTNNQDERTIDLVLGKLMSQSTETIRLEDIPLPKDMHNQPLPNTVPFLVSFAGDELVMEYGGGATANSLLGRFSMASHEIHEYCGELAALEQKANPKALFFDIGYTTGSRIDNVNRRKHIYDLELNLLNYDCSQVPLALDDLHVLVRQGKVFLRSIRYNKQMVPRLASAYNYQLSDLPVFRFLCDLQHQGTHKNFNLRLRDRLPALNYYPRIQSDNIILSPATWQISWQEVKDLAFADHSTELQKYLKDKGLPDWVRTGAGDRLLLINTTNNKDLTALRTILKKEQKLYLEEMPVNESNMVCDSAGKSYFTQFILTLQHEDAIYTGINRGGIYSAWKKESCLMPGKEWLYFEIYCHPVRADEILAGPITEMLKNFSHKIAKWFFIRYQKNGAHLRFRLQLKDRGDCGKAIRYFSTLIDPYFELGTVSDYAIKPYQREINRYGLEYIEYVEQYFKADSEFAMRLISREANDLEKYACCLFLLSVIEHASVIDAEAYKLMIKQSSDVFNKEQNIGPVQFRILNQYDRMNKLATEALPYKDIILGLSHQIISLLNSYEKQHRPKIFTTLFHMHVNRIFADNQRVHEMVIYYLAEKAILRKQTMVTAVS